MPNGVPDNLSAEDQRDLDAMKVEFHRVFDEYRAQGVGPLRAFLRAHRDLKRKYEGNGHMLQILRWVVSILSLILLFV